ncbi:hypothetical protein BDA96_04G165200 [Sorghum bicolor]|uniref:Secreted protein n=1 Tax=Sorghum bicolor TaxID=4558 RepID=A0A921R457_SORBI|nr:hypothetical protein BDA96_04G165200 [Sorghum bicolor]
MVLVFRRMLLPLVPWGMSCRCRMPWYGAIPRPWFRGPLVTRRSQLSHAGRSHFLADALPPRGFWWMLCHRGRHFFRHMLAAEVAWIDALSSRGFYLRLHFTTSYQRVELFCIRFSYLGLPCGRSPHLMYLAFRLCCGLRW